MKHFLRMLGVEEDATWIEIREGYKTQVKVWHPDRFIEDEQLYAKAEERTKEIHYALRRLEELKDDLAERFNPNVAFLKDYANKTNGGKGSHGKATFEDRRMGYLAESFGNWAAVSESLSDSMRRGAQVIRTVMSPEQYRRRVTTIRKAKRIRVSSGPVFLVGFACTLLLSTLGAYKVLLLFPEDYQRDSEIAAKQKAEREMSQLLLNESAATDETELDHRARFELVNKRSSEVRSPLIEAAIQCQTKNVNRLVRQGAALNTQDSLGQTALIWAAKRNCAPVVKMLLERGADPMLRSKNGFTAHRWAQWHRNSETLKVFEARRIPG